MVQIVEIQLAKIQKLVQLSILISITAVLTLSVPLFAQEKGEVDIDVQVKEIEPSEDRPAEEPPAGTAEQGSPFMFEPKGPFGWISQHPLALTVLQFPAEEAYILKPGESRFGYRIDLANVFLKEKSGTSIVDIDLEGLRQTFSYRRGINENWEIAVFVPFQYNSHGFMDGIIGSWHSFFSLPNANRHLFAKNQFNYVVASGNEFKIAGESDEFGIGDIVLTGKYFHKPETGKSPAIAGRIGLKLPTGDSDKQIGSGGFDFGINLVAQKTYGRWVLYGQTGYIFTGGNDFGLKGHDIIQASIAAEYQRTRRLSWLGQLQRSTNPYFTGSDNIDTDSLEMALGWKYLFGKNLLWEAGFTEDVVLYTGPDFGIFSQITYGF